MRASAAWLTLALVAAPGPGGAQQYRLPLERPGGGETQPYVTAYRDHDGGGGLLDWSCGTNTYNGHRGTDLGIGGFAVMDSGSRWVVAAADGEVTFAVDGCFDRCTSGACDCGGGFGNYVQLTHADGKRTYYGHMMNGSVQVAVGDRVSCGQRLGKVASSGSSTGPHLHFEPRYADNSSDDPFSGSCGGNVSFWVAQNGYNDLPAETCEGGAPPPPPPPDEATIQGVVWDLSITAGPSDGGNVRVTGTTVSIEGGPSAGVRDGDAYWAFTLAPGSYRITARREGYEDATREVSAGSGETVWASIGLRPLAPPAAPGVLDPPAGAEGDGVEPRRPDLAPPAGEEPEVIAPGEAPDRAGAASLGRLEGGCRCVGASPPSGASERDVGGASGGGEVRRAAVGSRPGPALAALLLGLGGIFARGPRSPSSRAGRGWSPGSRPPATRTARSTGSAPASIPTSTSSL